MARLSEEQYRFALKNAREEESHEFALTANRALLDAHDRAEAAEARVRELEDTVSHMEDALSDVQWLTRRLRDLQSLAPSQPEARPDA